MLIIVMVIVLIFTRKSTKFSQFSSEQANATDGDGMYSPVATAGARKISIHGMDDESRSSSFYAHPDNRYGEENSRLWINQVNTAESRIQ